LLRSIADDAHAAILACDRLLARPAAWWAAAAFVFALQAALIVTHRPWPDEYQAVQLAVQAPDLAALLQWLRYEGHPPLWYLILRALAHLMDPLDTLWVAALLIALPTQALILFASPFTRIERLLVALSEFMLFDFLAISRSNTLGAFLLVLTAALWRRRWVWLAIALLPFCDFMFGVLSGIFVLLKWREKALWRPGAALWLACGALAAWTVRPAPDLVSAFEMYGFEFSIMSWLAKLGALLVPFQGGILPQWNTYVHPFAPVAWAGFLALCWAATRRDPFHRLLLFGLIALTLVFTAAIYPLGMRHLMLIAMLLILMEWLSRLNGAAPGGAFRLWLAVTALCGLGTAGVALSKPFDTAHLAIAEIRARGLEGKHWMIFPDWRVAGLAAQSGMRFERPEQHCMLDFQLWNYRTQLLEGDRLTEYLKGEIERHGRSYLVSDVGFSGVPDDVLRPLATIGRGYDGLDYHLYVVGPDAPEKPVSLPECQPHKRPLERF